MPNVLQRTGAASRYFNAGGKRRRSYGRTRRRTRPRRSYRRRRRTYRRRRRRKPRLPWRVSERGFLPDKKLLTLTYADTASLDPNIGSYAVYEWRLNSLYDPNKTGTGGQPYGFDLVSPYYDRYTVIGAKVSWTFWYDNANNVNSRASLYHYLQDSNQPPASVPTTYEELVQFPGVSFKECFPGDARPCRLTSKVSIKKFFKTKGILPQSGDAFSAAMNNNPSNQCILFTGIMSPSSTANVPSGTLKIQIEFIAVFTEPKRWLGKDA